MFLYTTLFGILVSVVYVRTGSLVAASAVHALCNFFSIPSVEFLREQSPLYEKRYCPHCCSILMFRYLGSYLVGIILYCALFTTLLNPVWFHSQFYSMIEWFLCCSSKSIEITMIPWVASASIETLLKTLSHGANTTPLERSLRFSIISTEVCRW